MAIHPKNPGANPHWGHSGAGAGPLSEMRVRKQPRLF